MNNILLLEDLPEIRAWLKSLVLQVFPNARITECSRVQDALAHVQSGEKFDLGLIDLGLPDVAVFFTADADQDRARDALWFACHELAAERLPPEAQTLSVPRRLQLLPGSRLSSESAADVAVYRIKQRDALWLELELHQDAAKP